MQHSDLLRYRNVELEDAPKGGLMEKLVLSVPEVAEILGISRGTVYQLCREKRIPHVKLGDKRIVVPRDALLRFLDESAAKQPA